MFMPPFMGFRENIWIINEHTWHEISRTFSAVSPACDPLTFPVSRMWESHRGELFRRRQRKEPSERHAGWIIDLCHPAPPRAVGCGLSGCHQFFRPCGLSGISKVKLGGGVICPEPECSLVPLTAEGLSLFHSDISHDYLQYLTCLYKTFNNIF